MSRKDELYASACKKLVKAHAELAELEAQKTRSQEHYIGLLAEKDAQLAELREAVKRHKESMLPEDACEEDRELWALLQEGK